MTYSESCDKIMSRLVKACDRAGVEAFVIEPSTRVQVKPRRAKAYMAEVITLRPAPNEALFWWWTWGEPVCPAGDVAQAVKLIRERCRPVAQ